MNRITKHSLTLFFFCLSITFTYSQGNSCATAQALNTNGCTNGVDDGNCAWTAAGGGIVDPSCGGPYTDGQGWYTITTSATATSWVFEVQKSSGGGSNPIDDPAFQVYSGTCGALTEIACYNNDGGTGNDEKENLALAASTTYYIRVVDADGDMTCGGGGKNYEYSVCFYDFEPGDDCDNALPIALTNTCGYSTYSNSGFIASDEVAPTCGTGSGAEDMWFQFTTDATGTIALDLIPGTITDTGMEIYSGACGALVSAGCSDDKGLTPTYPNALGSRLQGTLAASTSYYARVWSKGGGTGDVEACFRNRPAVTNDACGSALNLTLSTNTAVTNWGTSVDGASDPATGGCNGSLDNSVWFQFTTTVAGDYTVDLSNIRCSQGKGMQMDVGSWSGASCVSANWTSSNCINPGSCADQNLIVTALPAATTYYIFIDGWGAMEEDADFDIMVSPPVALPINLTSFTVQKGTFSNEIKWTTSSEINNDYYKIERSEDGIYWANIETQKGAGNSTEINRYYFNDSDYNPTINYYRLTQVDYNGMYKTSNFISIDNSQNPKEVVEVVNILGQKVSSSHKGLVIIIYSDGSTLKTINQ